MSGHSQAYSQRNVSLRPIHRSSMAYHSPRSTSLPAGAAAFDEDLESLLPLETDAGSQGRETTSGRDQHTGASAAKAAALQKDRQAQISALKSWMCMSSPDLGNWIPLHDTALDLGCIPCFIVTSDKPAC